MRRRRGPPEAASPLALLERQRGPWSPSSPLCLLAKATTITLSNTGTFNGAVANTTAIFSTPVDYYFSPLGTFLDPVCRTPTAVSGTLTVSGGASCASTSGGASYQRVSDVYVIQATAGSCGVLVFTGNQTPCLPLPVDPCSPAGRQQEFTGVYTQAP